MDALGLVFKRSVKRHQVIVTPTEDGALGERGRHDLITAA